MCRDNGEAEDGCTCDFCVGWHVGFQDGYGQGEKDGFSPTRMQPEIPELPDYIKKALETSQTDSALKGDGSGHEVVVWKKVKVKPKNRR